MNEYFSQCHLLFFRNLQTGKNPPLQEGKTDADKVIEVINDIPAGLSFINPDISGSRLWPDESAESDETAQLIRSSFETAFRTGHRKVVALFSAPVGLTPELIREALLSLRPLDFCLGPDREGGLWLLGMNRYDPSVLTRMPWHRKDLTKTIIRSIGDQKKILYRLPYL